MEGRSSISRLPKDSPADCLRLGPGCDPPCSRFEAVAKNWCACLGARIDKPETAGQRPALRVFKVGNQTDLQQNGQEFPGCIVFGVTANMVDIEDKTISEGRFIMPDEVQPTALVCLD